LNPQLAHLLGEQWIRNYVETYVSCVLQISQHNQ